MPLTEKKKENAAVEFDLVTLTEKGTVLSDAEVAELYHKDPGVWVLLEILKKDEKGRAVLLRSVRFSQNKEELRNFVLNKDEWGDEERLMYFFTGFDGTCEINY